MAFYTERKETILLHIKVNPGKPASKITGVKNNELCLDIKGAPEKGKANKEVVRFLAKALHTSRSAIEIKSGHTSRHKLILLPGEMREELKVLRETLPIMKE
jgi:uncharacterized protein